ncbi:MAG: hypothetical protein HQM10_02910 [Candidatus Riflebacteria bacterium]|nr:hypothetical protein [Candidatus Riflebacteria bacterium]
MKTTDAMRDHQSVGECNNAKVMPEKFQQYWSKSWHFIPNNGCCAKKTRI